MATPEVDLRAIEPKRFVRWMRKLREEGDCLVWPYGQPIVRVGNKVHRLRAVLRQMLGISTDEVIPCNRRGCSNPFHAHDCFGE